MGPPRKAGSQNNGQSAGPGPVDAAIRIRPRARVRLREDRARSVGAIAVTSLLVGLSAAALLYGGRAAIVPLLQTQPGAHATTLTGSIVMAMPDGVYCRNMSFNNATGVVTPGGVERCVDDEPDRSAAPTLSKFAWGHR